MTTKFKIAILLSSYNGEKFLAEQLDSILLQSYDEFLIVVRDDGSSDGTMALLQKYSRENPGRFHLLEKDNLNRGASGGFSYLIEYVLANKANLGLEKAYMMFCDQDDIWDPGKIEKQVSAMLQAEQEESEARRGNVETSAYANERRSEICETTPVLVHSDLQVVSEQNILIAKSFIKYQGLKIERNQFPNLVTSNLVTGCTALINESLAKKAVPISKNAIMHDWWLAMIATAFGRVVFLDTPLVRYRQHGTNTIGAKEFRPLDYQSGRNYFGVFFRQPNPHLHEVASQAQAFLVQFKSKLGSNQKLCLRIAARLKSNSAIIQGIIYRLLQTS